MDKKRVSLSLSLRKKGRQMKITPIVDDWVEQGLDTSEEMSESILIRDQIKKSASLSKYHNTYDMIKQTLSYSIKDEQQLEEALENTMNKIVIIDGAQLTEFFSNPISFADVSPIQASTPTLPSSQPDVEEESDDEEDEEEELKQTKPSQSTKQEEDDDDDEEEEKAATPTRNRRERRTKTKPAVKETDDDDDDDIDLDILNNM